MNFNVLSGLRSNTTEKKRGGTSFWSAISNLHNASYSAKVAADRLQHTIRKDVAIRDAVAVLKQAKNNFQRYGATEAAMAVFNQNEQLSQSLGMAIPKVTAVNAAAVGKTCCNKISSKISDTVKYAKHYGNTVAVQSSTLINKTYALAEAQKYVLEMLCNRVSADIKTINAKQFSKATVCGYTRPIFMERIDALQYMADNLHRCNNLSQCNKMFAKQLSILGWNVSEDGEITEATPEEVAEQAPNEEEVMNPVADPETGEPIEGEETPALVEAPNEEQEEEEEIPASAPQEQPMAVFGWNPNTIKQAAASLHKLSNYSKQFAKTYSNMLASRKKLNSSVESYKGAIEKTPVLNTIESCRKYNAFVGNLICNFNTATNELVNQALAMYGILKDTETFQASANAVSVNSITAKTPWGLKKSGKGFFNADEIPEGDAEGEEDGSDVELPGDLEDDTEGPTKAEEPEEGATTDLYYDKKKKKLKTKKKSKSMTGTFMYDEDEIPEGDAEGEEDDAGVELPGDLEDDTEGPTKATDPEEDEKASDIWGTAMNSFLDEDEPAESEEETAEEGDTENEEEVSEEEETEAEETVDTEESEGDEETIEPEEDEESKASSESIMFFDEDEDTLPENTAEGEEDTSGVELPGDLEDDTEGPTEAEEPEEDGDGPAEEDTELPETEEQGIVEDPENEEATTAEDFWGNNSIPEGDANGETDDSDTELPGDLEDDTEGPTKATDPIARLYFNEDNESDGEDAESESEADESGDEEANGEESDDSASEPNADDDSEEEAEESGEGDEEESSPMKDFGWTNEDEPAESGDAVVEEDDIAEVDEEPTENEAVVEEETAEEPEGDGDEPADGSEASVETDDVDDDLDTVPKQSTYEADPDEDVEEESLAEDSWNNEDIEGPNTPDEYPTEPAETPDGVDSPNGDVDIPDAQTEPYMQPESTPPEDIPNTSINNRRKYFE